MRKVILVMGMGLDGIGAAGWVPLVADNAAASEMLDDTWEETQSVDTFIFGRTSYEVWKNFWPSCATSPTSTEYQKRLTRSCSPRR
jgi:hypothetical protein